MKVHRSYRPSHTPLTRKLTALLALSAICFAIPCAKAEEPAPLKPSVSVSAGVFSKYIWRYQSVSSKPVLQPNLSVGLGGFSLDVWGNMELTDHAGADLNGQFTEIDLTVGYAHTFEDLVDVSCGVISYEFPNSSVASTHEVYAGVGLQIDYLNPFVTVYYDFDEVKSGIFADFGIGHSFELPEIPLPFKPVSIDCAASTGFSNAAYNRGYFGDSADSHALSGGQASLSVPFKVDCLPSLSLTPSVQVTSIWDKDMRHEVSHPTNVIWGLSMSLDF